VLVNEFLPKWGMCLDEIYTICISVISIIYKLVLGIMISQSPSCLYTFEQLVFASQNVVFTLS